jgi:hypothetical protein
MNQQVLSELELVYCLAIMVMWREGCVENGPAAALLVGYVSS